MGKKRRDENLLDKQNIQKSFKSFPSSCTPSPTVYFPQTNIMDPKSSESAPAAEAPAAEAPAAEAPAASEEAAAANSISISGGANFANAADEPAAAPAAPAAPAEGEEAEAEVAPAAPAIVVESAQ